MATGNAGSDLVLQNGTDAYCQQIIACTPRVIKMKASGGMDLFKVPLQIQSDNGQRGDFFLETPIFESFGILTFGNTEKDGGRRSIKIGKGACPWLEAYINFINSQAFPSMLQQLKTCPEKVPPFSKGLLQPNVQMCQASKTFFENDDGHWFKLSKDCRIFNAETREPITTTKTDPGLYKLRLRCNGYFLGPLGASSNALCSLTFSVEQVAVKLINLSAPQDLVIDLTEFEQPQKTGEAMILPPQDTMVSNRKRLPSLELKKKQPANKKAVVNLNEDYEIDCDKQDVPAKKSKKVQKPSVNSLDLEEIFGNII